MKVTLNWLKELVDFDLTVEQVSDILTMLGLEVEEVYPASRDFSNIVIGHVISVAKHPNADKLKVCQVDTGDGQSIDVVCGAPNCQAGGKYPFAKLGAKIGNFEIKSVKLRGEKSEGMLCSESELGISERSEGLMELSDDAPVGTMISEWLGEPDVIFDIFITPNRADCMNAFGIARELAAAVGANLKKPQFQIQAETQDVKNYIQVEIQNPERCYRYAGRYLENVQIQASPLWLVERLHNIGVRSINNVVDITNYVMMETGQPLHAFDYDFISGQKIIVRTAEEGEKFTTLDDKEHTLKSDSLMICDAEKPVAMAGIMGGQNSEVNDDTKTVFLESAYFEPNGTRKTASELGIMTESSRRFERGIDPNGTIYAMNRAAQLMVELAGATVVGEEIDVHPTVVEPNTIELSTEHVNRLLGTVLMQEQISDILSKLELECTIIDANLLSVKIPTVRIDLDRPVDLIEEIARCLGYDNIAAVTSPPVNQLQEANPVDRYKDQLRNILIGFGLRETLAFNLTNEKQAEIFLSKGCKPLKLINPLSQDLAVFRPSIIQTLLLTTAYNKHRQMPDLHLFEFGNVAWRNEKNEYIEKITVGGVLAGHRIEQGWADKATPFDFYDIKGLVESFLKRAEIEDFELCAVQENYWDSEAVGVKINGKYSGSFGRVSKNICSSFKIKQNDVFVFWFDFEKLYEYKRAQVNYEPVPRFPSVPFDFALVLDADIPAGDVEAEIWNAAGKELVKLSLFDYYKGEQVAENKKSLAFSLTFSSKDCTLSDENVEKMVSDILAQLNKKFGAELRPR